MRNLKILFLLNCFRDGGAERVTLNLATEWRNAGADVVIAVMSSNKHDSYNIPQGVRIVPLDITYKTGSILSVLRNSIKPIIKIWQLLRQERPDIAIGAMTVSPIGLALVRTSNEIIIGHEHTHPPKSFSNWTGIFLWIWNLIRRFSYYRLDSVVALTPQSAEWLRKNTYARKVVAIPNWISLPLPDNEPRIEPKDIVPAEKKLLLAVGRLDISKRFGLLLDVFAQVAPHHPDWHLVILGEGDLRKDLEAQISHLGLTQQVSMPGFAGNISDWYQVADALSLTSDFEGFAMVLVEAMAHRCPVISVDCPVGPRNIIRNNENGLLVPHGDFDALVSGLDRMLSDDALRKRLASKAVGVLETYSKASVNAEWQNMFDMLLQGSNTRKMQS